MKKFIVNDLYIARPMKLIKASTHSKLAFPYDILSKTGLIAKTELRAAYHERTVTGPFQNIKRTLQKNTPRQIYRNPIITEKNKFQMSETTIVEKTEDNVYKDIFTGVEYPVYDPSKIYEQNSIYSSVIDEDYISELYQILCDEDESDKMLIEKIKEAKQTELTMQELQKIRVQIDKKMKKRNITYTQTHPITYIEEGKQEQYYYDRNGVMQKPQFKTKKRDRRKRF